MPDPGRRRWDVADWGRSLLWLGLLGTSVVFSARTTEAFERPKVAVVQAVALLLAFGMAAVGLGVRPLWPRMRDGLRDLARDPLSLGVVLSLAAALVSTLLSVSPRTSLLGAQGSFAGLFTFAAFVVVYFAARRLCGDSDPARGVLAGAVIGLGVAVVYGVAQLAGLDPFPWAPIAFAGVRRVFSTQGHPNSLSQLLAAGAPLSALFFVRAARGRRYGEAAVLALLTAGAAGFTLLTVSRAGVLALLAALAVAAWGTRADWAGRRGWAIVALLAAGALALAFAIASDPDGGLAALAGRLARVADAGALRHDPRRFLWSASWGAFRDHPLFGAGLDCLSLVFGRYRTPSGWSAEWGETPLKAHGQPLEILATRGLLGGAAALVLLLGVGRSAVRALRRTDGDPGLAVAVASSLAALGAHNLFHFPTVAGTTLAATLAGILSRLADPRPREDDAPSLTVSPVGGLAAMVAAAAGAYAFVVVPLRADVLGQAATVLVRMDPERAVALGREAVRLDPGRDLLWLRFAAALQSAGVSTSEPARRRDLLEEARRVAERGVDLVPVNAYDQAHLGTLLADLERETPAVAGRDEVESAFRKAASLDPNNADILMAAANAALAAGDMERARGWAVRCAELYPGFASPRGVLGALALAEGRRLSESGAADESRRRFDEATRLLKAALAEDWHGDDRSRDAAEANLAAVLAGRGS